MLSQKIWLLWFFVVIVICSMFYLMAVKMKYFSMSIEPILISFLCLQSQFLFLNNMAIKLKISDGLNHGLLQNSFITYTMYVFKRFTYRFIVGFGKQRHIAEKKQHLHFQCCIEFAYTANLHISFLHMIHEVYIAFTQMNKKWENNLSNNDTAIRTQL